MDWDQFIKEESEKEYFQNLMNFIKEEEAHKIIFPPKEKRMNAFMYTPFNDVNVVIIGQDPYHDVGQAHGLAFSVESGKIPPSLRNIYKELSYDLNINMPKTGNLSAWAKQGVLLLNSVLTVEAHRALSHQNKGWEIFTKTLINHLSKTKDYLVFILWGNHAKSYLDLIDQKKHDVIVSAHPSPLAASRGFFGSKPFSKTNQYLMEHKKNPIDWNLL